MLFLMCKILIQIINNLIIFSHQIKDNLIMNKSHKNEIKNENSEKKIKS